MSLHVERRQQSYPFQRSHQHDIAGFRIVEHKAHAASCGTLVAYEWALTNLLLRCPQARLGMEDGCNLWPQGDPA
jgi:hypothetical protein